MKNVISTRSFDCPQDRCLQAPLYLSLPHPLTSTHILTSVPFVLRGPSFAVGWSQPNPTDGGYPTVTSPVLPIWLRGETVLCSVHANNRPHTGAETDIIDIQTWFVSSTKPTRRVRVSRLDLCRPHRHVANSTDTNHLVQTLGGFSRAEVCPKVRSANHHPTSQDVPEVAQS